MIHTLFFIILLSSCNDKIVYHQNLELVWETDQINWSTGSLILDNDFIYGHSLNDSIFKIDISNGKVLWKKYSYGSYFTLQPVVCNNRLYVGGARTLKAFNKQGDSIWSEDTHSNTTGLVIWDSIIYNTRTSEGLFANDSKTGEELWSIKPDYQMLSTSDPAIKDSLLIIGEFDYVENIGNHLACVNLNKKVVKWKIENRGYGNSEAIIENNDVFFNADSAYKKGFTYRVDLDTGKVLWKRKTNPETTLPPLLDNGRLYLNSYRNGVVCLNAKNGEIIWNTDKEDLAAGTEFLLHKEVLYFGTQRRKFIGINKNAEIVFQSEFYYGIGNPFIYNGDVYVYDGNGRLFRIKNDVIN